MSQITPLTEVQAARSPRDLRSRLDFWQALSGACLAIFVCFHLIFEGSVVISPAITDWIGWAMEVTYVAQIAAPVVLLLIIFHFWIAARKMPFVQVLTAVVILAGAFFHVYTVMTDLPIEVIKSAQRLHMGWWLFYVFFLPCTILHTGIGIYRIAVKYGFLSKEKRYFWRGVIWSGMGCYLVLGTCALIRVWFIGN